MDIKQYAQSEGEQGSESREKPEEKNSRSSPKAPIRPVSGVRRASDLSGQKDEPVSVSMLKAANFITKKQAYDILKNSYRADSQGGVDLGASNRQMHLEYQKRVNQSKVIEEQAAQRRAQAIAENSRKR